MDHNIVKIESLSHRYSRSWAVRNISFTINRIGIVGLLGSNGAGKSTTMNILCGVLNQTEGSIFINGIDLRHDPGLAKKQIGFLPQTAPLHLDLTVNEYLIHCAYMRLMEERMIRPALEEVKAKCGISHFSNRLIRNLSGGYRQRVGIAQAIIHKPMLVVLDEPTNGLDPNQIVEVRALIREIASERTVIFSSHILSEVELLCDEIRMIENGRLVFSDTMKAFNNYVLPHSLTLHLENPPPLQEFLRIPGITDVLMLNEKTWRLFFENDPEIAEKVIETSVRRNWRLREINIDKSSIDEVFAKLSGMNSIKKA